MDLPLIHLSSNLPNYPKEYHFAGIIQCMFFPHDTSSEEVQYTHVRAHCNSLGSGSTYQTITQAPHNIHYGCFQDDASTSKVSLLCRGQPTKFLPFITFIWCIFQEMRQLCCLFKELCKFQRYKCNKGKNKFGANQVWLQEFQFTKLAWWVTYFAVTQNK